MHNDLQTTLLWILGTGAITLTGWAILGWLLRWTEKEQPRDLNQAPLGIGDRDAERDRQMHAAAAAVRIARSGLVLTPLVFVGSYVGFLATGEAGKNDAAPWFFAGGALMSGYAYVRYKRVARLQGDIQWHHEAFKMVDRAIAPLIPRGYIVFRDFKVDDIAVDHLLIGPKGVFAIQILVRKIANTESQAAVATVTYDGRTLFFPRDEDPLTVENAEKQAERVAEWISERIGMPIAARGIVALPGWQVKRISAQGISVINPSQLEALFQYVQGWPLSEEILLQIGRLLEKNYGYIQGIPLEKVAGEGLPG